MCVVVRARLQELCLHCFLLRVDDDGPPLDRRSNQRTESRQARRSPRKGGGYRRSRAGSVQARHGRERSFFVLIRYTRIFPSSVAHLTPSELILTGRPLRFKGESEEAASPPKQDEKEESSSSPSPSKADSSAAASEPQGEAETIQVPQMAESISEGTLKTWMKKVGDYVQADEEIASIETDKIDVTINAPKAGTIVEILAKEDETVTVGQDLYKLAPGGSSDSSSSSSSKSSPSSSDEGSSASSASKSRKPSDARTDLPRKETEPQRPEPKVQESKQPKPQPEKKKKDDAAAGKEKKPAAAGARTENRVRPKPSSFSRSLPDLRDAEWNVLSLT